MKIIVSGSAPGISRISGRIRKIATKLTSPIPDCFARLMAANRLTGIPAPHGDHHGLWIDPNNPNRMINGNDGGATITVDGGKNWSTQMNQPTAQFYHVTADNDFPYHIYGTQQDNSSVGIATASDLGFIGRPDWDAVGGGESGYVAVIRATRTSFTPARTSEISRASISAPSGAEHSAVAARSATATTPQYRNTAIPGPCRSFFLRTIPTSCTTLRSILFRSNDGGHSWQTISPDLSRNDKTKQQDSGGPITKDQASIEFYDLIFTVAESPKQKGVIWAGTDDGLIQITRDDGKSWTNVTPKSLPEWAMVSLIEPSPFDAGTAYAADRRA